MRYMQRKSGAKWKAKNDKQKSIRFHSTISVYSIIEMPLKRKVLDCVVCAKYISLDNREQVYNSKVSFQDFRYRTTERNRKSNDWLVREPKTKDSIHIVLLARQILRFSNNKKIEHTHTHTKKRNKGKWKKSFNNKSVCGKRIQ